MKIKKRFIVLGAVLLMMLAGFLIYSSVAGSVCRVELFRNQFSERMTPEDFSVEIDDPSVVELQKVGVYQNGDFYSPYITFRSLKSGETTAKVTYHYRDEETGKVEDSEIYPTLRLRVLFNGAIVELNELTFTGWELVKYGVLIAVLLIVTVMLASFLECFFKAEYSYAMVGYGGVAGYLAFMLLLTLYDLSSMKNFAFFLEAIADTGFWFAVLTAPVMLLISALIAVSNIWLLRREGFRLQNMLGIGLSVFWGLGLAVTMQIGFELVLVFPFEVGIHISYSLAYVLSFLECMLLSTIICAFLASFYRPPRNKDYLIILGCGIRRDGSLTPILKGRVDAAIRFERRQFAETGRHAKFVPSGGQGSDEVISESEAMARYLMEQGYPAEQIVKEDKSVNTYQNILFSRDKIKEDAGTLEGVKAGFATTNYHIFRGYILSKKHHLDAQGISAKTKWYFFPNAFLREFAGLLADKKWSILICVVLILLAYTVGVYLLNVR